MFSKDVICKNLTNVLINLTFKFVTSLSNEWERLHLIRVSKAVKISKADVERTELYSCASFLNPGNPIHKVPFKLT